MRLVFIATGDIALPAFRHLLEHGPRPLALVTQPDKPTGRHQTLTPPAIKVEALAAGIPVFQPEKIGDIAAELAALEPDILVVMAYGQILREDILNLPARRSSISTPHCFPSIAEPPASRPRSTPGIPRPASPPCTSSASSMPAT